MTWQGGTSPGFPRATRRLILARDPVCRCPGCPRCTHPQSCKRPSTEADHIRSHADGGSHAPSNGRGICTPCHAHRSATQGATATNTRRGKLTRTPEAHPGHCP